MAQTGIAPRPFEIFQNSSPSVWAWTIVGDAGSADRDGQQQCDGTPHGACQAARHGFCFTQL